MKYSARIGLPLIRSQSSQFRYTSYISLTPVHIRNLFQTYQRHVSSTTEPSTPELSIPGPSTPESSSPEPAAAVSSVPKLRRVLLKKRTRVKNDSATRAMVAYAFNSASLTLATPELSVPNPQPVLIKRPGVVIKHNPRMKAMKKYALKVASPEPTIRFQKGESVKSKVTGVSWINGQQRAITEDGTVIRHTYPRPVLDVEPSFGTVRKVQFTFRKVYDLDTDDSETQKEISAPVGFEDLKKDYPSSDSSQAFEKDGSRKIVASTKTGRKTFRKVEGVNKRTLAISEAALNEDVSQNHQALAEDDSVKEMKPKKPKHLTFRKIVAGVDTGFLHIQEGEVVRARRVVSKFGVPLSQLTKENDGSEQGQANKETGVTKPEPRSDTQVSTSSSSSKPADSLKFSPRFESKRQHGKDKSSKSNSSKFTPQESTIPYGRKVPGVLVRKLEKEFVPIRQYRSGGLTIRTHIAAGKENADTESPRELARKMDFERKGILSKKTSSTEE